MLVTSHPGAWMRESYRADWPFKPTTAVLHGQPFNTSLFESPCTPQVLWPSLHLTSATQFDWNTPSHVFPKTALILKIETLVILLWTAYVHLTPHFPTFTLNIAWTYCSRTWTLHFTNWMNLNFNTYCLSDLGTYLKLLRVSASPPVKLRSY